MQMESILVIANRPTSSIVPHLITKRELLEEHSQKLQDNHTLESHTSKIIETFGGIDQIMTDYLSSNDIQLTQVQLQNIQQILWNNAITVTIEDKSKLPSPHYECGESLPSTSNAPKIGRTVSKFHESNTKTWRYRFSKSNTYIHQLFSDDIARNIISVLYNKYFVFLNIIIGIIWVIWAVVEHGKWSAVYDLYKFIFFSFNALYLTLIALTINKQLLRKSVRHFLFWFKLIVGNLSVVVEILCVEASQSTGCSDIG